jgi:hypothetical protein
MVGVQLIALLSMPYYNLAGLLESRETNHDFSSHDYCFFVSRTLEKAQTKSKATLQRNSVRGRIDMAPRQKLNPVCKE